MILMYIQLHNTRISSQTRATTKLTSWSRCQSSVQSSFPLYPMVRPDLANYIFISVG